MVERPIKKSERQVKADADNAAGGDLESNPSSVEDRLKQGLTVEAQPRERQSPNQQDQNKRGKKGRGSRQKTEEPSRANPALLRGPRPTKLKPSVASSEDVSPTESLAPDEETAPDQS